MPLTVVLGAIPAPELLQWSETDPPPKALPEVCTVDEPLTFWFASIKRRSGGMYHGFQAVPMAPPFHASVRGPG
eukprot:scaffold137060_cov63-Phaeocystis_antarctica.AAC.2